MAIQIMGYTKYNTIIYNNTNMSLKPFTNRIATGYVDQIYFANNIRMELIAELINITTN